MLQKIYLHLILFLSLDCMAMEDKPFPILRLPHEILELTFSFLHKAETLPEVIHPTKGQDLASLAFVCKKFNSIIKGESFSGLMKRKILTHLQKQLKEANIVIDIYTTKNLDTKDDKGMTALMHAGYIGNLNLVMLLLNNGVDSLTKDAQGLTVLQLVVKALNTKGMVGIHYDTAYLDNNGQFIPRPRDEIDDWIYFKSIGLTNENEEVIEKELTEEEEIAIKHLQEIYKILRERHSKQSNKSLNISQTQFRNNPAAASDNATKSKQNCCVIQ